jgi:thiol-disulfide isomerase/thioredoxin
MRRQWVVVAAAVTVLGAAAWAAIRWVPPPTGTEPGDRLPDYRVARPATGDSVELRRAFAGHVTLVNLWATWCEPCREEMPSIERAYEADSSRGFRVAAVSVDDGPPGPVLDYVADRRLTFDVFQDRSGGIQDAYRVAGLPHSVLIDRHGVVRYVALGARAWDSDPMQARIDSLLDGR